MLARSVLAALCLVGCARSSGEAEPSSGHEAEEGMVEEPPSVAVAHNAQPTAEGGLAEGAEDALTDEDEAHRAEPVESDGEGHAASDGEDLVASDGEEAGWAERLGPDSTLCADALPSLRLLMSGAFEDTLPSALPDTPDLGASEAAPPD